MEPTLRVGDYLLVNHLAYGPRLPFTNTAIEFGQPLNLLEIDGVAEVAAIGLTEAVKTA